MRQLSEERQVGGNCFLRVVRSQPPGPWQLIGQDCGFTSSRGIDLSANPQQVLDRLREIGSATYRGRTGTGPRATDTWAFSYNGSGNTQQRPDTVTGTVAVNVTTGLVTQLKRHTVVEGGGPRIVEDTNIDFSDFGTPVVVSAPHSYPPPSGAPAPFPSGTR
jgi:hypothetical protein